MVVQRVPPRVVALPRTGLETHRVMDAEVVVVHQQQHAVRPDRLGQPVEQAGRGHLLAFGRVEPLHPVGRDDHVEPVGRVELARRAGQHGDGGKGPGGLLRVAERTQQPGHRGAAVDERLDDVVGVRAGDQHGPAGSGEAGEQMPQHRTAGQRRATPRITIRPGEHLAADPPQVRQRRGGERGRVVRVRGRNQSGRVRHQWNLSVVAIPARSCAAGAEGQPRYARSSSGSASSSAPNCWRARAWQVSKSV